MAMGVNVAAERLGLSARRVRALIAAGALRAELVGGAYVLDERDVDAFAELDRPGHVRAMSPRVAWATAALLDDVTPTWLRADELSRLRARLTAMSGRPGAWRAQMLRTASSRHTWRAGSEQISELLADPATRRTGASATNLVTDQLVGPPGAAVWVADEGVAARLRDSLGLLRAENGNVSISVPDVPHLESLSADGENVYRLIVATDLLLDADPRANAASHALIAALADELLQRQP